MPFLFTLGKGHLSTTYFCSVYTELSKEEKNVEFVSAGEGADLHFQPRIKQLLALTVGWAALPSLLPLIWGIRNNRDLPTLLVNLFLK